MQTILGFLGTSIVLLSGKTVFIDSKYFKKFFPGFFFGIRPLFFPILPLLIA